MINLCYTFYRIIIYQNYCRIPKVSLKTNFGAYKLNKKRARVPPRFSSSTLQFSNPKTLEKIIGSKIYIFLNLNSVSRCLQWGIKC